MAILCVECGYHLQEKVHLTTRVSKNDSQSLDPATKRNSSQHRLCDACHTTILQRTYERNGGLCAQCIKPRPTGWIQRRFERKVQGVTCAVSFSIGLGTGGVLEFAGTQSLIGGIALATANLVLVFFAVFGFRRAKVNGRFIGAEPDMFLVLLAIGYVAGLGVGLLLPVYDFLFPIKE